MTWLLIVVAAGAVLAWRFRDTPRQTLQETLKIFESIAIIGALAIATGEYYDHVRVKEEKKSETVTLLSRQIDPKSVNEAFFYMKHSMPTCASASDAECVKKAKFEFDKSTWPLIPLFSSAEQCVRYQVCDRKAVVETFRQSFGDFRAAYYRIHADEKPCGDEDHLRWMETLREAIDEECPAASQRPDVGGDRG